MGSLKRFRPSPAMIVAIIALVLSRGGTSYAAITLPRNSVGTTQIKRSAVTAAKIKNGDVTGAKVKNGSLTLSDISAKSLSQVSRIAYGGDGTYGGLESWETLTLATAVLTVPKAGFVLVEGWVNASSDEYAGEFRVNVRADDAGAESPSYAAVQLGAGMQGSTGNATVFPVTPSTKSFSVSVFWDGGGSLPACGYVTAQYIPYNGVGSSTP
jgi:hypothetical protein